MSNLFSKAQINWAAKVSEFMMNLYKIDEDRYGKALEEGGLPFGDMAYGSALEDWNKNGRPKNAWFSTAPGQKECKLLMAFRKEISEHFGLEILTIEEGERRRKSESKVITKKVFDWVPN
jgi:hypothetical protein